LLAFFYVLLICRLQFNVAFFIVVAYCLYYLTLEPVAGLSWSVLVGLPLWLTATAFQQQVHKAGLWALGIHVFSWYMQVRERRRDFYGLTPAQQRLLGAA
jgi:uncharacterized membrane protein YGL010W